MRWKIKDSKGLYLTLKELSPMFDGGIGDAPFVVTVGDSVSHRHKAISNIRIVNGGSGRISPTASVDLGRITDRTVCMSREVSALAFSAVSELFDGSERVLFVDGDEGLLILPCVLFAPDGTRVLWKDGMVGGTRCLAVSQGVRQIVSSAMARYGEWSEGGM